MNRIVAALVRHPVWTSVGALIGIVGVVLSIVQLAAPSGEKSGPDLEVAALAVGAAEQIDGMQVDSSYPDDPGTPTTVDITPVDITLKNNGGEPSVITQAEAELLFDDTLMDCTSSGAGPAGISANYAISLPTDRGGNFQPATTTSVPMQFTARPGSVDRMQITVGPQVVTFYSYPVVMVLRITLIHDGSQRLVVGTVAFAANPDKVEEQIQDARGASCAEGNLERLNELYAIEAVRAPNLEQLREKYEQLAGR